MLNGMPALLGGKTMERLSDAYTLCNFVTLFTFCQSTLVQPSDIEKVKKIQDSTRQDNKHAIIKKILPMKYHKYSHYKQYHLAIIHLKS
jgi:hypothetical protein